MRGAIDIATAVQAVVDAVSGTAASPADRIRVLLDLADVGGNGPTAACCRRLAAVALAQAAAAYTPNSYDDAVATMTLVAGVLDAEITAAGDAEADDTYLALRTLRTAVVADLVARGANLAPLIRVHRAVALPSVVLAQQLYDDAARADELVRRVDPIHPAFMPGDITVLAR